GGLPVPAGRAEGRGLPQPPPGRPPPGRGERPGLCSPPLLLSRGAVPHPQQNGIGIFGRFHGTFTFRTVPRFNRPFDASVDVTSASNIMPQNRFGGRDRRAQVPDSTPFPPDLARRRQNSRSTGSTAGAPATRPAPAPPSTRLRTCSRPVPRPACRRQENDPPALWPGSGAAPLPGHTGRSPAAAPAPGREPTSPAGPCPPRTAAGRPAGSTPVPRGYTGRCGHRRPPPPAPALGPWTRGSPARRPWRSTGSGRRGRRALVPGRSPAVSPPIAAHVQDVTSGNRPLRTTCCSQLRARVNRLAANPTAPPARADSQGPA